MRTPPVALTVAATDSGGAAGVPADLATFAAYGVHGACAITAITAQDTTGVRAISGCEPDVFTAQLDAVAEDLPVAAIKAGMLGSPEAAAALADRVAGVWAGVPLVVDPVLAATSGAALASAEVLDAYRTRVLGVATLITPNLPEARALADLPDGSAQACAAALAEAGCAVLVTGGDQPPGSAEASHRTDWYARPGAAPVPLRHPAVQTRNDHGSGCTFSAAIAAALARARPHPRIGTDPATGLNAAIESATRFTTAALARGADWRLGRGRGPVPHTFDPDLSATEGTR